MLFSAKHDFKDLTFLFIEIINKFGFKISHPKTVYKKGKLEITGCLVDDDLKPTEKQLNKYYNPNTSNTTKLGLETHFARLKND